MIAVRTNLHGFSRIFAGVIWGSWPQMFMAVIFSSSSRFWHTGEILGDVGVIDPRLFVYHVHDLKHVLYAFLLLITTRGHTAGMVVPCVSTLGTTKGIAYQKKTTLFQALAVRHRKNSASVGETKRKV
jgi:hypothetical protein